MKYASTVIENDGTTYKDQTSWALYIIKKILDCFIASEEINNTAYWSLDSTKTAGQYEYKGFNYIYNFSQDITNPALCCFFNWGQWRKHCHIHRNIYPSVIAE